jgi:beta-glucosidase-like glycosyl hydrolase|eukprot:COSAG01_NODE_1187_length_11337_cov_185.267574_13_plen_82_part_00
MHSFLPLPVRSYILAAPYFKRFGRISELPSEDPIHSGSYGAEMISGMQEHDKNGHPKMLAYLKHYSFYSREQNRMHSEVCA